MRWLLKGSQLNGKTLERLQVAEPALRRSVGDPLWEMLALLGKGRGLVDSFALNLGMGGIPGIAMNSRKAMNALCNCPDWHHLGYVLALLGSHDRSLQTYRTWLRKHFSRYLILLCLGEPLCFARNELFELLNGLREQERLGPIDDWPSDLAAFEQARESVMAHVRSMQACGWIGGGDLRSWTFVGYYLNSSSAQRQDPEGLARRVAVALQQHERHHFGFCQPRTAA